MLNPIYWKPAYRRLLLIFTVLCFLLTYVVGYFKEISEFAFVVAIIFYLLFLFILLVGTTFFFGSFEQQDEWVVQYNTTIYARSFIVMFVFAAIAITLYSFMPEAMAWVPQKKSDITSLLGELFLLIWSLPGWISLWFSPDQTE